MYWLFVIFKFGSLYGPLDSGGFLVVFFWGGRFWLHGLRGLSSLTRDLTWATAVTVPSPNLWTTREFPTLIFSSLE